MPPSANARTRITVTNDGTYGGDTGSHTGGRQGPRA